MITQQKMIEQAVTQKNGVSFRNYKNFDYSRLCQDYHYSNDKDFLNRNGITFEDETSCLYLTGNELLFYPELANCLREINDYPILKRTYAVNQQLKGLALMDYVNQRIKEAYRDYQSELATVSSRINNLIYLHGTMRYTPIINSVEIELVNKVYQIKTLIINGVKWYLEQDRYLSLRMIDYLDLYRLLNISYEFKNICLEDAQLGTPYIALRIKKTSQHIGHVVWYNLNTQKLVSKADRVKGK